MTIPCHTSPLVVHLWLGFANEDLGRVLSKSTAGTLVADKAGPATVASGEGLVGGWFCGVTVFPPLPFGCKDGPAGVFKGADSLVNGLAPGVAIRGQNCPLAECSECRHHPRRQGLQWRAGASC